MATRSSRKTPARFRSHSRSIFWRRVPWWRMLFALLVLAGCMAIYVDAVIRAKFDGRKWTVPAKVYARPLELYESAPLTPNDMLAELEALGYRYSIDTQQPGSMVVKGDTLLLHTRGFAFTDGIEPARRLRIDVTPAGISALRDHTGASLDMLRLEPLMIGGIYPANNEDRILLKLNEVPPLLLASLLAVEDHGFYEHGGISLRGIARAMWANLQAGEFVQGGSTITQQLVKNFFLNSERSLARKLIEIPMAVVLDLRYTKEAILETYLNEIYLGQEGERAIHGFGLAAQHYFRQPLSELLPHQVALLVGIVKGASYYDPWRHPERAFQRRNLALQLMAEQNIITPRDAEMAAKQPLDVVEHHAYSAGVYPAFLDLVKRQLRAEYAADDLQGEGLQIFTTLDPLVQRRAEQSLGETVKRLEKNHRLPVDTLQGAVVTTDSATGEVLALVGSRSPKFAGFNRAMDAKRQMGSTVKPWVYAVALQRGLTLATALSDEPYSLKLPTGKLWQPRNYDNDSHAQVLLYESLAHSYNQATARLGVEKVGVKNVVTALVASGLQTPVSAVPSVLLGAVDLSPYEVAGLYQTLAADGFRTPLRCIREVTRADRKSLSHYPLKVAQVFDEKVMYQLLYAMQAVMREGTGASVYRTLPAALRVAGKTGTSNEQRDSWFAGFTGNYSTVVWVGRDDNKSIPFTGGTGALEVWTQLMSGLQLKSLPFERPAGIEYQWVDHRTGQLTEPYCAGAVHLPLPIDKMPASQVPCRVTASSVGDWVQWLLQ